MTEQELIALLVALHEKAATEIYNRVREGSRQVEDILNETKTAEAQILGDYFSQFGDDDVIYDRWNSGKNYIDSLNESIERTRRDLERIFQEAQDEAQEAMEAFLSRRNHETEVIAVTEETRIAAAVTVRTYAYYRYMTAGGDRVCAVCRPLEGMVFDTVDARIGQNCPPMHPYCRCRIEPLR